MEITPRLLQVCKELLSLYFVKDVRLWNFPDNPHITLAADLLKAKILIPKSAFLLERIGIRLGVKPVGILESIVMSARRFGGEDHFHSIEEFIDAAAELVAESLEIPVDEFRLTIQPVEGEPWNFKKKSTQYFSIKKNKWIKSSKPPMIVPQKPYQINWAEDYIQEPVLDWCKILPTLDLVPSAVSLQADNRQYLVSHCFSKLDGLKNAIKTCGGLLFPSLAIGHLSSNNFGPFTLIFDPVIVLKGIKPYRTKKGVYPVHVYPTDTWTHKTDAFMGPIGRRALIEWVGRSAGKNIVDFDFLLKWESDEKPPLKNSKQLAQRLKKLERRWGSRAYPRLNRESGDYPYVEAKVNGIVPVSACAVALAPKPLVAQFKKVLKAGGFSGEVIGLDASNPFAPDGTFIWKPEEQWNFGWQVRDAVLSLAKPEHSLLTSNPYAKNPVHPDRLSAIKSSVDKYLQSYVQIDFDISLNEYRSLLEEVVNHILASDPTSSGKYLSWVTREYMQKRARFPEDIAIFQEILTKFHKFKHLLEQRDIMKYSKGDLALAVKDFELDEETQSQAYERKVREGKILILGGDTWQVFQLTTPEATREAAKGTAWCVKNLKAASDYLASGVLFLFEQHEGVPTLLAHGGYERVRSDPEADAALIPTFQVKDVKDEEIGAVYRARIAYLLREVFKNFMSQKIKKFGSAWDVEHYKELGEPGNPPYEFGRLETDEEYLQRWFIYAKDLIGGPDSETEKVLLDAGKPFAILRYIEYVKHDLMPEAEPIIVTDANALNAYMSLAHWIIFRLSGYSHLSPSEKHQTLRSVYDRLDALNRKTSSRRQRANPN